jgi:hypothetical protein
MAQRAPNPNDPAVAGTMRTTRGVGGGGHSRDCGIDAVEGEPLTEWRTTMWIPRREAVLWRAETDPWTPPPGKRRLRLLPLCSWRSATVRETLPRGAFPPKCVTKPSRLLPGPPPAPLPIGSELRYEGNEGRSLRSEKARPWPGLTPEPAHPIGSAPALIRLRGDRAGVLGDGTRRRFPCAS